MLEVSICYDSVAMIRDKVIGHFNNNDKMRAKTNESTSSRVREVRLGFTCQLRVAMDAPANHMDHGLRLVVLWPKPSG